MRSVVLVLVNVFCVLFVVAVPTQLNYTLGANYVYVIYLFIDYSLAQSTFIFDLLSFIF